MSDYALVKYKQLKLLVVQGCDMQPLLDHLPEIELLAEKVSHFYANLMTVTKADGQQLQKEARALESKIGYTITGVPFTNHDAEMYAASKGLNYELIELHGNMRNRNASKPEKETEQINIRVERPLKTLAVKHVNNSNHKNLTKYIEYLIKKDLGI